MREKIVVPDGTTPDQVVEWANATDPRYYYITYEQRDTIRKWLDSLEHIDVEHEEKTPTCPCGGEIADYLDCGTGEIYYTCVDCGRLYHGEDS